MNLFIRINIFALKNVNPQRDAIIPLGAQYGHLPATPFHATLQKVRGEVVGFTWLRNGNTTVPKILLTSWVVKGKYDYGNSLVDHFQIDDLYLKVSILRDDCKNNITESYPRPDTL